MLRKETEGLEKLNFTKECIAIAVISWDFVCRVIAVAAVKINKMTDSGFPRWERKQGEFLLIFSNDDCIKK